MKKLLIFGIMLVVLSSFVFAQTYLNITMTGVATPAPYAASASRTDFGAAWRAINDTLNNADNNCGGSGACGWQCNSLPCSLIFDMGNPNSTTIIEKYIINSYNSVSYAPTNWTLEGSADNSTYFVIDYRAGSYFAGGNMSNFTTNSNATTGYRFYKFSVTATSGLGRLMLENLFFYNKTNTAPSADNINISIPNPRNINFTTTNININATMNNLYTTNVSLFINGTSNMSSWFTTGTNNNITFNPVIGDGNYTYYIRAIQTNDSTQNETTSTYTFYVDSHSPTLTTNLTTNSIVKLGKSYTYQFNFSDNLMLWGYNFTLNGVLNNYTQNLQNTTASYNWTNNTWVVGQNNISVWVADAHTATSIEEYNIVESKDSISFDNIEIKSLTATKDISLIKEVDSYKFGFETTVPTKTLQIEVPKDCYYQNKDNLFRGWFVCPSTNKWIDFENEDGYDISVDLKTNIITITSYNEISKFIFNSIGSLNEVTYNYTLYGWNYSVEVAANVTEFQTQHFNLTIYTGPYSYDLSANISWNGTVYNTTETNYGDYTIFNYSHFIGPLTTNTTVPYFFNFTINGTTYNTSLANSTLSDYFIDNCSVATDTLYNFNFYNFETGVAMNGTTDILFSLRFGSYNVTFPLFHNANTTANFCIYPDYASLMGDVEANFVAPGFEQIKFWIVNQTISLPVQNYSIYFIPTTNVTSITVALVDENDKKLQGYFIQVYKYVLSTNNYTWIQTKETNINGQIIFGLDVNGVEYQFRVLDPLGTLIYTEPKTLLTATSYTLRITLGENKEFTYLNLADLDYTLNSDYLTRSFILTWDDASNLINNIQLLVVNTSNTSQIFFSDTSLLNSGTLNYTIPGGLMGGWTSSVYVNATSNGEVFYLTGSSLDYNDAGVLLGSETLFYTFIFTCIMIFGALSLGLTTVIIVGVVALLGSFFMGLYSISLASLIGLIVVGIIIAFLGDRGR